MTQRSQSLQQPRLIVRENGEERIEELLARSNAIGRSKENEVEIDDISSSRRHCRIQQNNGSWVIEDLQSRNGTMVNGVLIKKKELQPGDCIEIGKVQLFFERIPTDDLFPDDGPRDTMLLPTDFFMEPLTEVTDSSQIDAMKREREIFLRLLEIGKRLCSMLVLQELLDTILDTVLEITGAERGFLVLKEGENDELSVKAARNIDKESVKKAEVKVSHSISRHVLREGTPVLTGDARADRRTREFPSVVDLRLESVLCVPLRIRGEVVGVIYVDNRFEVDSFHRTHLRFIEFLADQAAVFIDNARLFEENRKKREALGRSKEEVEYLNRELQKMLSARELRLRDAIEVSATRERNFTHDYSNIITQSPKMFQIFEILDRVIDTDISVLVQGSSGTGKELIAKAIHELGRRSSGPFVSQNCAAIPPNLLESEFFGHVKGAFTGAVQDKKGLFQLADGGTLFLDEIGDMSLDLQTKLLRVLEEGEVRPVGGKALAKVDVRIISATNQPLLEMIGNGEFREDLYYRLNVINIALPPLRERREDIPLLIDFFLGRIAERTGLEKPEVDETAFYHLHHYDWPGNIRELENEVERIFALSSGRISADLLSPAVLDRKDAAGAPPPAGTLKEVITQATEKLEKSVIANTLEKMDWNKSRSARQLGVSRPTLDQKIDKYGLKRPPKKKS
ncbi:MAG: sigma 54-interacting transcriptional regulator [Planctomycetota bacterium]